jgi:hypothetical protein
MDDQQDFDKKESNKKFEIVFEKVFKMVTILPDIDTAELLKEVSLFRNIFDDDEDANIKDKIENQDSKNTENNINDNTNEINDENTEDLTDKNVDKKIDIIPTNDTNKNLIDSKTDDNSNNKNDDNLTKEDKYNYVSFIILLLKNTSYIKFMF